MKRFSALFLMTVLIAMSCEENAGPQKKTTAMYAHSLGKWSMVKKILGNTYEYEVLASSWTGYNQTTGIRVVNGVVISRSFELFRYVQGNLEPFQSYEESGAELGSHDVGSPAITIDELYGVCAKDYLTVNREQNEVSFSVDKTGVMQTCGYAPKGCADDCFVGVYINAIDWE